jgi:hypothetical protein
MLTTSTTQKLIIGSTWLAGSGKKTVVMAVPKQIAMKYDIYKKTNILITPMDNGFFVKRLQVIEE